MDVLFVAGSVQEMVSDSKNSGNVNIAADEQTVTIMILALFGVHQILPEKKRKKPKRKFTIKYQNVVEHVMTTLCLL